MIELGIGLTILAMIAGVFIWITRTFVSKTECRLKEDCVESKLEKVHLELSLRIKHLEKLILGRCTETYDDEHRKSR